MLLPGWGLSNQKKVKRSRVIIVGVGGLGCPVSIYLTVAGVGRLTLVDHERFELSNLNRQILGWQDDVEHLKVEAAAEKLMQMNPDVEVEPLPVEVNDGNVRELVRGSDVVVDGMDNWRMRIPGSRSHLGYLWCDASPRDPKAYHGSRQAACRKNDAFQR